MKPTPPKNKEIKKISMEDFEKELLAAMSKQNFEFPEYRNGFVYIKRESGGTVIISEKGFNKFIKKYYILWPQNQHTPDQKSKRKCGATTAKRSGLQMIILDVNSVRIVRLLR
jgi:hypothetical protein